ncbi:unnamed protein product [Prunus armeniaca]|uniref:Uncharacterized protein n=1 Tax=Prunus armeniaca TaxID=36596 RepID=A0A6J5V1A2_PRUAR|nr:unnamed protein product [Prunus armeniaca]
MQRMQNKRAAAGDRSKNERKAARKDSRKAAPRIFLECSQERSQRTLVCPDSRMGCLASGLKLLKGAAIVAKAGVDIANKIGSS